MLIILSVTNLCILNNHVNISLILTLMLKYLFYMVTFQK
ncbi:hypothetical protein CV83915_2p0222 (plasmid) [Escherichia coli]|uniref:Uncharacterized protein n=1 Tax=Escherichia coli TaxID=562 RepID=A0A2H4TL06_ECOLX|nr:hypothetical protein CV83915_2p0222 [Escherichia coli]